MQVHTGVQFIRDKQEILESQLHLAKLQVSKVEQQSEAQHTPQSDSLQQAVSAPLQLHQQLSPPPIIQAPPTLSSPNPPPAIVQPPHSPPNAPLPPPQQNLPTSLHLQNQFVSNQIPSSVPQREPFFPPPPVQTQEATNQQYQLPHPHPQQLQPQLPGLPQQQYQPPPHPQYSQPPLPPQQHPSISAVNPSQPQPSLGGHHPEEAPFSPPQNYPPSLHQQSHLPSGNPPSQQFYGAPSHMYEPPSSRPNPGFSAAYSPPSGTSEPYPYGGSPSQYGGSSMKQQQLPSAVTQGTGSGYPQLPTARTLPHALPTASGVGGGSGSAGTGNRVPIDDVVDKVTNMGFSREQVRVAVRKLTESGQSVDLNVVLDKLMNDGEGGPLRGWFGR